MKQHFLFLLFICASFSLSAQELKQCGADEMRIETLKKNPAIANAVIRKDVELEKFTSDFVAKFYQHKTPAATYLIPVVFHVIHNFGAENISDAQILDGLDILNKTFRKQLADTASIVAAFKPLHADCEIEFRLAQLDPNGNCTNGIDRIASPLTYIGDHSVKSLVQWPPRNYLNIYIVSNAAGLAGHCVWPADADSIPAWDGIVIGSDYIGSIGTSNYTRSVALAHECGHYLNLQHIWGGNNVPGFYYYPCADTAKDCAIDDLVADTPPTIGWLSCNLSGHSCGNVVDNVQNAMDYSYCNRMFTYGQKARMQACLNDTIAGRNHLWSTANLIATGVLSAPGPLCKADFSSDKTVVCQSSGSNQVNFSNTSYNGSFTSILWSFPGGTPVSSTLANPTVTYSTPGKYDVVLKVNNGSDSMAVVRSDYITVLPSTGSLPPYSEGFETLSTLNGPDWFSNSFDSTNSWQIVNTASFSGSHCVMVDAFNNTESTKDELFSKVIDLSGSSSMNISFRYAFAAKDSSVTDDKLQLYFSNNCNTSWLQRLNITGTALETAPATASAFVPGGTSEWKQISASVPASWLSSSFRFKFVFTANGGNNIYLDDINLDTHAGIEEISTSLSDVLIFPNPADDAADVEFELNAAERVTLNLVSVLGQTLQTKTAELNPGRQSLKLSLNEIPNGCYFVTISADGTRINKKIQVMH